MDVFEPTPFMFTLGQRKCLRCRAHSAHVSQSGPKPGPGFHRIPNSARTRPSRPDSGLDLSHFLASFQKYFQCVPFSLSSRHPACRFRHIPDSGIVSHASAVEQTRQIQDSQDQNLVLAFIESQSLFPGSQGQNLALTVLSVP